MTELTATKAAAAGSPAAGSIAFRCRPTGCSLGAGSNLDQVRAPAALLGTAGNQRLVSVAAVSRRAESSHGYDVVDHGTIDPAIGDFAVVRASWPKPPARAGMGILLDVVPNHMGINDPGNAWWLDVLENGEGSYFADFFDIDWQPAGQRVAGQDPAAISWRAVRHACWKTASCKSFIDERRLQLDYWPRRFPLAPPIVADRAGTGARQQDSSHPSTAIGEPSADWTELQSIITQLRTSAAGISTRCRRRWTSAIANKKSSRAATRRNCCARSPAVRAAFDAALAANQRRAGQSEELRSTGKAARRAMVSPRLLARGGGRNQLPPVLRRQRPGGDSRRRSARFRRRASPGRAACSAAGWVTGLRIDHPDGLRDPQSYFKNLQALYRSQTAAGVRAMLRKSTSSPKKFSPATSRCRPIGPFAAPPATTC